MKRNKKIKYIKIVAVIVILIFAVSFVYSNYFVKSDGNSQKLYTRVVYPVIKNLEQTVDVGGTVDAANTKSTFANTSLKIEDVLFKIGDRVKKGEDVLRCTSTDSESSSSERNFTVNAPASGAISAIAEQGKVYDVNSEEPLITVMNLNNLIINAKVPETDVRKLKIGFPVKITSGSSDIELEGKISRISAIASNEASENDNSSVAYIDIEVAFQNKGNILRPNYNVDLKIITKKIKDALVVPKIAVMKDGKKDYIYILGQNNIVHKKIVQTGIESNYDIQVSGITKDDKIISNISSYIQNDSKIKPENIIFGDNNKQIQKERKQRK